MYKEAILIQTAQPKNKAPGWDKTLEKDTPQFLSAQVSSFACSQKELWNLGTASTEGLLLILLSPSGAFTLTKICPFFS